jgi:hypothetical protein
MTIGTKPPYYGNIAVASFIGDSGASKVQIANLPLSMDEEAAYASYVDGNLVRVMVINMHEFNYSLTANESCTNPAGMTRPTVAYAFSAPTGCA